MKTKAEILASAADRHGHELMILTANVHNKARTAERAELTDIAKVWDDAHALLQKAEVLLAVAERMAYNEIDR